MNRFAFGLLAFAMAAGLPSTATVVQAAEKEKLVVAVIGGQLGARLRELYEPWAEKNNVDIEWVSNASSAETVAKLAAQKGNPEFDIAFGDNITHYSGTQHGLWAPLDEKIVTNLADVSPTARRPDGDGVGFGFFYTGLFYRADEFEKNGWAAPKGWADLFRPELCGRVGIQVPTSTYTIHTLIMLGGGSIEGIPAGIEKIAENRKCIPVLEPVNKLEEKMQLGEYVIGVHGQIRAIPLIKRGQPVRFVLPSEGTVVAYSTLSVVKDAPHPAKTQSFVNWILEPEVQAAIMTDLYYGPVNARVVVPADLLAEGVPDVATTQKMLSPSEKAIFEDRREWSKQLERAMAR